MTKVIVQSFTSKVLLIYFYIYLQRKIYHWIDYYIYIFKERYTIGLLIYYYIYIFNRRVVNLHIINTNMIIIIIAIPSMVVVVVIKQDDPEDL